MSYVSVYVTNLLQALFGEKIILLLWFIISGAAMVDRI